MKISKLMLILLIIGLVVLAGCSNNKYNSPPSGPTGAVVGGGCGVAGVPVNAESVNEIQSVEVASAA